MEQFTRKVNPCSNCKKFLKKCRTNRRRNSLNIRSPNLTDIAEYFFPFSLSPLSGLTEPVLDECPVDLLPLAFLQCLFYCFPFPPSEPSSLLLTSTWPKLQGPLVLIGQEKVAFPVFLRVQAQIFLVLQSRAFAIQQNPFLSTFDGITTAQQLQQVLLEAGWGLLCLRNSEEVRVNGVNGAE